MSMNVIGLDLSLTGTGIATAEGTRTLRTTKRGMYRLQWLRAEIINAVVPGHKAPDLVVIEDYAFSRGDAHSHALGELGGVVRLALWEAGIAYVDVKASNLKRYATGKGVASKGAMIEAACKRLGGDYGGDDNRCDAAWLRAMALDHYGEALVALPKAQRDALVVVPWPEMCGAGGAV